MLDDAEDVDTYFIALIWETLNTPAYINNLFRQILTSKDDIAVILGYADVTFHHGIFDIIRADVAPPLTWFKSFPASTSKDLFGIYFLLLEKPEYEPIIYVGSRTNSRWQSADEKQNFRKMACIFSPSVPDHHRFG